MKSERSCIYPKDVLRITGKSERACCRMLQTIRRKNGKESHQFITIDEFANHTGIPQDLVRKYLNE